MRNTSRNREPEYLGDWRVMRRFKTRAFDRSFIRRHTAACKAVTSDPDLIQRQVIKHALAFGMCQRSIAEILNCSQWIVEDIARGGKRALAEAERAEEVCRRLRGLLTLWEGKKRAAEAKAAEYGHTPKAILEDFHKPA